MDEAVGEGFEALRRDLCHDSDKVNKAFLAFKSKTARTKTKVYAEGDLIDCLDTVGKWCAARIVKLDGIVKAWVHFEGWSDKWNEWIAFSDGRIAPHRTHTSGYTGNQKDFGALQFNEAAVQQFVPVEAQLHALCAEDLASVPLAAVDLAFVEKDVATTVQQIISSVIDDMQLLPRLVGFLQHAVDVVTRHMRTCPPQSINVGVLEILWRVFDKDTENRRLFVKYGITSADAPQSPPSFAKRFQQESYFLSHLINYFGERGGFDLLCSTVFANASVSISVMRLILKVADAVREKLLLEPGLKYLLPLQALAFDRLNAMTDDELKHLNKDVLPEMLRHSALIQSTFSDAYTARDAAEKFRLDFSLKLLACSTLERKVHGLTEIKTLIDACSRQRLGYPAVDASAVVLTEDYICSWMESQELMTKILGSNTHMELVKRCPPFFQFLAQAGRLTPNALHALWMCGFPGTCHESMATVVHDTITELVPILSIELLDELFAKIEAVPPRAFDARFFAFVCQFCNRAIKQTRRYVGGERWYGMSLFWNLMQEESGLSLAYQRLAMDALYDQLAEPISEPQIPQFLRSCVETVDKKGSVTVLLALQLCQRLLELYQVKPTYRGFGVHATVGPSRAQAIASMTNHGMSVLDALLSEMQFYCDQVVRTVARKPPTTTVWNDEAVLVPPYAHGVQIRERLDFILYLLTYSPVSVLTVSHMDILWQCLVESPFVSIALAQSNQSRYFSWLSRVLLDAPQALGSDVVHHVFQRHMCRTGVDATASSTTSFSLDQLTEDGYIVWERLFRAVNSRNSMATPAVAAAPDEPALRNANLARYFQVSRFDLLVGLEALWSIVLSPRLTSNVAKRAMSFLISLHLRLDHGIPKSTTPQNVLRAEVISVHSKFLNHIMTRLQEQTQLLAVDVAPVELETVQTGLLRTLDVLESFLDRCDADRDKPWQDKIPRKLTIAVDLTELDSPAAIVINVKLDTNCLLSQLRSQFSMLCKAQPPQVLFLQGSRVMHPHECDHLTIDECDVVELHAQAPFRVVVCIPSDPRLARPKTEQSQRAHFWLANDQTYFDQLFSLLRLGGIVAPRVWTIMGSLPTNQAMMKQIKSLALRGPDGMPAWQQLFEPRSELKLLYTLQIVEGWIATKEERDREEIQEVSAWCRTFLYDGGLSHLSSLLMGIETADPHAALRTAAWAQQCAVLVIKLLLHFLTEPLNISALSWHEIWTIAFSCMDFPRVVGKLLDICQACTVSDVLPVSDATSTCIALALRLLHSLIVHATITLMAPAISDQMVVSLFDYPGLAALVSQGLIAHPNPLVRSAFHDGLLQVVAVPVGLPSTTEDGAVSSWVVVGSPADGGGQGQRRVDLTVSGVSVRLVLLSTLLGLLPGMVDHTARSGEYFQCLNALVASLVETPLLYHADAQASLLRLCPGVDVGEVLILVTSLIESHRIVETQPTDSMDSVLHGLLQLAVGLMIIVNSCAVAPSAFRSGQHITSTLMTLVFSRCLFDLPTADDRKLGRVAPPACKTVKSRRAAFALLQQLAQFGRGSAAATATALVGQNPAATNFDRCVTLLLAQQDSFMALDVGPAGWDVVLTADLQSTTGYVGIKNLGCICYINSLLQQLYMLPTLRARLLAIDTSKDDPAESFLYQLQYILAFLQESERMAVNPVGFCHAFKDWDGNPTDVRVQMDTQEFYHMLLDRIDERVKGTRDARVLQTALGGVFSNDLICKGCPHSSARDENFYSIEVEIKNKRSLHESLDSFVKGDMLEGANAYMCGQCKKKVDTLKRVCLKKLPPTVVFQLKRFEFNVETQQRVKLNDEFEFPLQLNLRKYTVEGLAEAEALASPPAAEVAPMDSTAETDSKSDGPPVAAPLPCHPPNYYEYELAGVLIHTGSANGGHYYSYIKERPNPSGADSKEGVPSSALDAQTLPCAPVWIEFNDQRVSPFDIDTLAEKCFGGYERPHNAYLVFYDRITAADPTAASPAAASSPSPSPSPFMSGVSSSPSSTNQPPKLELALTDPGGPSSSAAVHGGGEGPDMSTLSLLSPATVSVSGVVDAALESAAPPPLLLRRMSSMSRVLIPPAIYSSIWDDNRRYWSDRYRFDPEFHNFMWATGPGVTLVGQQPIDDDPAYLQLTQMTTRFVFETLAHAPIKNKLFEWCDWLMARYRRSVPACHWLLDTVATHPRWARMLLLECPHVVMRRSVARLLQTAIAILAPTERLAYSARVVGTDVDPRPAPVAAVVHDPVVPLKPPKSPPGRIASFFSNFFSSQPAPAPLPAPVVTPTAVSASAKAAAVPAAMPRIPVSPPRTSAAALVEADGPAKAGGMSKEPAPPVVVGSLKRCVDALVALLRWCPMYWKHFGEFFGVMHFFASRSPVNAAYLVQNYSLLPTLLELIYPCDGSFPRDRAAAAPVASPSATSVTLEWECDAKGKRVPIGDPWQPAPDWVPLLKLLGALISTVVLPTASSSPPSQQLFSTPPLSASEMSLLSNTKTVNALLRLATTKARGKMVASMMTHLCWGSPVFSQVVLNVIAVGIEENEYDQHRAFFRVLAPILALRDELQGTRVGLALSSLLNVIEAQQLYWKATDYCIEQLIRLTHAQPNTVGGWMFANRKKWTFLLDWLEIHPMPPQDHRGHSRLLKPAPAAAGPEVIRYGVYAAFGASSARKKMCLESIASGRMFEYAYEESDDDPLEREFEKDQIIDCQDSVKKWCLAEVKDVSERQVLVHYCDWDSKWDEWIDKTSSRLAPMGKHTAFK